VRIVRIECDKLGPEATDKGGVRGIQCRISHSKATEIMNTCPSRTS